MNTKHNLSNLSQRLTGQPMFKLLAEAKTLEREGKKILHFEIGDSCFSSPQCAKDAVKNALDSDITSYVDSKGIFEFREAIVDYTEREWKFRPHIDQILVSPANAVIDFLVRCVVDPGDEVIFPDPGFCTYISVLNYNAAKAVPVPVCKKSYRLKADAVAAHITPKTKLIIINSPSNPLGTVMNPEDIKAIGELALKKGIYLLSDEVYSKILFDSDHISPVLLDQCRERILLLNSFSKVHSMSGWRLGYVVGPVELIQKLNLLLQTIVSCIPPFIQMGGMAVLRDQARYLPHRLSLLKERRDVLYDVLNEIPEIICTKPDGAFYMFPDISGTGLSGHDYCDQLLHSQGVCLLPGEFFGEFGNGHVRICFGKSSISEIKEALEKISAFHKTLQL